MLILVKLVVLALVALAAPVVRFMVVPVLMKAIVAKIILSKTASGADAASPVVAPVIIQIYLAFNNYAVVARSAKGATAAQQPAEPAR